MKIHYILAPKGGNFHRLHVEERLGDISDHKFVFLTETSFFHTSYSILDHTSNRGRILYFSVSLQLSCMIKKTEVNKT